MLYKIFLINILLSHDYRDYIESNVEMWGSHKATEYTCKICIKSI